MADKKISQLTTLAQADVAVTADFLPIVDTSATETKKATPQALVQAGATGATLPVALGAVGTPSYTFTGDLNTGLWSPAADAVAVSTNGVERLRVNDSGVGIGAASGTSSGYATAPQLLNYSASATNLLNASDTSSTIRSALYRDTTGGGTISMAKFRGTYASPTAVQSGDTSGRLWFEVWGGSNLRRIAEVGALVDTYTSDTNISGALYFATSTSGNSSSNEKMRLTAAGNLGIGTASPTALLDVNADTMRLRTARTPASAGAAGNAGDICWDETYLYICTATNTWRRIAHATW